MRWTATLALSLSLASTAAAQTSGFWLVGLPPGGVASAVHGLSHDGSIAVGASGVGNTGPGFTWTVAGGRDDWGMDPGMPPYCPAQAVSSTGSVIVGWGAGSGFGFETAFRRVGDGPLQNLGTFGPYPRSAATGVSGDGGTVVGWAHNGFGVGQAFRWTEGQGMQGLGALPGDSTSQAYGISRDGSTIVGSSRSLDPRAFRWTETEGIQLLPNLPGAAFNSYEALGVNGDGSVIIGVAPNPDGRSRSVRWVNGVIEDLTGSLGAVNARAISVDDSGTVVGGTYNSGPMNFATVWTPETGSVLLSSYLALHGITVPPDFRLEYVYAVSGDGATFAGLSRNVLTNQGQGFVATIPSPPTILLLLAPLLRGRPHRPQRILRS